MASGGRFDFNRYTSHAIKRNHDNPLGTFIEDGIVFSSMPAAANRALAGSTSTAIVRRINSQSSAAWLYTRIGATVSSTQTLASDRTSANKATRRQLPWTSGLLNASKRPSHSSVSEAFSIVIRASSSTALPRSAGAGLFNKSWLVLWGLSKSKQATAHSRNTSCRKTTVSVFSPSSVSFRTKLSIGSAELCEVSAGSVEINECSASAFRSLARSRLPAASLLPACRHHCVAISASVRGND